MTLRIGRTLPPAAAPLTWSNLFSGLTGHCKGTATVERFLLALREHFGSRHCFAVSSGKAALVLILRALRELSPERDEVLIPAYTCFSVPSAVIRAGLKVRLCDLAPGSLDYDFDLLAVALDNPRLLCVVSTHLFGVPADVTRVRGMIAERKIFLVEDAAQAMGGEWQGKKLGTLGDVGLFSLGRGKALSTVEGGVILTGSDHIGKAIAAQMQKVADYSLMECLKVFVKAVALLILVNPRLYWLPNSLPFLKLGETLVDRDFPIRRLSPFQAGVAKGWQMRLAAMNTARAANVSRMICTGIRLFGGGNNERGIIRFPHLMEDDERRRELLRKSGECGLGVAPGYPSLPDCTAELGCLNDESMYPVAQLLARRLVSLPVHPLVEKRDLHRIAGLLQAPISSRLER